MEENRMFLEKSQQDVIDSCPFKVGDVIKGEETLLCGRIRAIRIQELKVFINNDGVFGIVAKGHPMNLDGSYNSRDKYTMRKLYINEKTQKFF